MILNVDLSVLTVHKIDYGKQSVIQDDSDDDHVGSYYGNYNYGTTVSEVEFIKWCEDVSHNNEDDTAYGKTSVGENFRILSGK